MDQTQEPKFWIHFSKELLKIDDYDDNDALLLIKTH